MIEFQFDTFQMRKWQGNFGKEYTQRNIISFAEMEKEYKKFYRITRLWLNKFFLKGIDYNSKILEIGSNIGNQLICLQKMGFTDLWGIEPQDYAIEIAKKRTKGINIVKGNVFDIPFKNNFFDLVFTSGLLIHIAPLNIRMALKEIHRVTNKYIWGFEYWAEKYEKREYRRQKNLLWKTNFPYLYLNLFEDLRLLKEKKIKDINNEISVMFLLKKYFK